MRTLLFFMQFLLIFSYDYAGGKKGMTASPQPEPAVPKPEDTKYYIINRTRFTALPDGKEYTLHRDTEVIFLPGKADRFLVKYKDDYGIIHRDSYGIIHRDVSSRTPPVPGELFNPFAAKNRGRYPEYHIPHDVFRRLSLLGKDSIACYLYYLDMRWRKATFVRDTSRDMTTTLYAFCPGPKSRKPAAWFEIVMHTDQRGIEDYMIGYSYQFLNDTVFHEEYEAFMKSKSGERRCWKDNSTEGLTQVDFEDHGYTVSFLEKPGVFCEYRVAFTEFNTTNQTLPPL